MKREILHMPKAKESQKGKETGAINQHKRMAMGMSLSGEEKGKKVKK